MLRQTLEPLVKELAAKRSRDAPGAARCHAFLTALTQLKPFEAVLEDAFKAASQR